MYMQATKIAAEKTAAEIGQLLVSSGARRISHEYGPTGEIAVLTFSIVISGREVPFRLPINSDPVFEILNRQRSPAVRSKREDDDREQAHRVAWRQVLRWIQAQLALIETGMVTFQEVMLPYALARDGQTLYQHVLTQGLLRALPAPAETE